MTRYYLDPSAWTECFRGRTRVIDEILMKNSSIVYSDIAEEELLMSFLREEIRYKLSLIPSDRLVRIKMSEVQFLIAEKIAKRANISFSDVIHAVIAKDSQAKLITTENFGIRDLGIVETIRSSDL